MIRFDLKKKRGDIDGAIIALSDAGIVEMHLKHYAASKTYLRRAISLSKSTRNQSLLSTCIRNYIYIWRAQGKSSQSIPLLKRQILWARKAERWDLVVDLTELLPQLHIEIGSPVPVIEKSWTQAIAAADGQSNLLKKIALLRQRYSWIRQLRNPDLAIGALQSFLKLTERRKILRKEHVEALDEIGTCLQNQEKYNEAEQYLLKAFDIAKRDLDGTVPGHLLNNYAELLRKTDRSPAAIPLYKQAIAIDKSSSTLDDRLLTEHNLTLALDAVGRRNEARQMLIRIQKMARKEKLWEHFVRAQLAIANIDWLGNRRTFALRRYARVRLLSAQHQLQDLALHAALNEARLLQEMDRNKQAVTLLQSFRDKFPSSEHYPNLSLTLGYCLIEQGQHKKAIKIFEEGLRCPQATRSPATVASLRAGLFEANLQAGQELRSHVPNDQVLSANMSALKRIKLLKEKLFAVALHDLQKRSPGLQVQRLLDEIQQMARDNKQPTWISEAYEHLAHIMWSKDKNFSRNDKDCRKRGSPGNHETRN
jgi:tetratricopeptide (TPR) repeat protein